MVEPITDREGVAPSDGRVTEVIRICGVREVEWRTLMACVRVTMSTMLMPESHLCPVSACQML